MAAIMTPITLALLLLVAANQVNGQTAPLTDRICTIRTSVSQFFTKIKEAYDIDAAKCERIPNCGAGDSPDTVPTILAQPPMTTPSPTPTQAPTTVTAPTKADAQTCANACAVSIGNFGINYTDFKFYTGFVRENAQLLSTAFAEMPHPNELLAQHGTVHYSNLTCDSLGTRNYLTGGNPVFNILEKTALQTDNIFAVGQLLGNGSYWDSEFFYNHHSDESLQNPQALPHYCLQSGRPVDEEVPLFYSIPQAWMQKQMEQATGAAYLGSPCRQLCQDHNSTLSLNMDHCNIPVNTSCPVLTQYSDGLWVPPYFDCFFGHIWMITYSAPVAIYRDKKLHFFGFTAIDIDLDRIPIDQCLSESDGYKSVFANTHLCDVETSVCRSTHGKGSGQLRRGQYICDCKSGYYYSDGNGSSDNEINGSFLETQADRLHRNATDSVCRIMAKEQLDVFRCKPCQNRCKTCSSGRDDCRYQTNDNIIIPLQVINCIAIAFVALMLAYVMWKREEAVIRIAGWKFLVIVIGGAVLSYIGLFASRGPTAPTCLVFTWFTELGFVLSYGSILLKSWRIDQVFVSRSVFRYNRSYLKNYDLYIYLTVLLILSAIFVVVATAADLIGVVSGETTSSDGTTVYFDRCTDGSFKYVVLCIRLALLLPCCYLCFKLRRVLNDYAETREISLIVYLSTLAVVAIFIANTQLQGNTIPEYQFMLRSIEMTIVFTAMLVVLCLPKIRKIHWPTAAEEKVRKKPEAPKMAADSQFATLGNWDPRTVATMSCLEESVAVETAGVSDAVVETPGPSQDVDVLY